MTKREYERMASLFAESVFKFCDICALYNTRFDKGRFLDAVLKRLEEEKE